MCYFCKGKGHWKKSCTKYKKWLEKQGHKVNQKAHLAEGTNREQYLFSTSSIDGWIIDSGATCHIAGNKAQFTKFDSDHREKVVVANGQQLTALGKGTICVKFINTFGNTNTVHITDVLYIPGIKGNLISVKRLAEKGYTLNFSDYQCVIERGQNQIAVADAIENLYKLRTANQVCTVENTPSNCIHEWHSILGH